MVFAKESGAKTVRTQTGLHAEFCENLKGLLDRT